MNHYLGSINMRRQSGITLIEVLIALGILGILMTLAFSAIVGTLRIQSDQEVITAVQARMRRAVGVITQDIRSAVFGSLTSIPYQTDEDSISFMLLAGAAGYPVENEPNFEKRFRVITVANSPHDVISRQFVMVNGNGQGVVFRATAASALGSGRYQINHAGCRNTIPYVGAVQLFEISTIGLRHDSEDRTIYQSVDQGGERPFAFNIDGMELQYVYGTSDASAPDPIIERPTPYLSNGVPARVYVDPNGINYLLDRVKLTLTASEPGRGNGASRTYAGYIDLSSNQHFQVKEVLPCGS